MRPPELFAWLPALLGTAALVGFLVLSGLALVPAVLLLFGFAALYPYRHHSSVAPHLLWLLLLAAVLWLLQSLGLLLLPPLIALLAAYLFDPVLERLQRYRIPRWVAALVIVLAIFGAVGALSVLIFPKVFAQLDTIVRQISNFYTAAVQYLESRRFFRTFARYGIPPELLQNLVQQELLPRLEQVFQALLSALLSVLTELSRILTHLVNLVLLPILMVYLMTDFPKLRRVIREVLQHQSPAALRVLQQANPVARAYIGWILFASAMIGLLSGILYALFDIPYAVMLGLLSGLLNPIPYFGVLVTMGAGAVAILLAQSEQFLRDFLVMSAIINGLHFINAYFVEPRVLGKRVGLHPVMVILALLLFGKLFGIAGMLLAVPTTAVAMTFFNQWRANVRQSAASVSQAEQP
jgi:predicted PurR-regulated permease PerM